MMYSWRNYDCCRPQDRSGHFMTTRRIVRPHTTGESCAWTPDPQKGFQYCVWRAGNSKIDKQRFGVHMKVWEMAVYYGDRFLGCATRCTDNQWSWIDRHLTYRRSPTLTQAAQEMLVDQQSQLIMDYDQERVFLAYVGAV